MHCANADLKQGFDCFGKALEIFKDTASPIWRARALEHLARIYAGNERWNAALQAISDAIESAEESRHPDEQVQLLFLAANILRESKTKNARDKVARKAQQLVTALPADIPHGEIFNAAAKRDAMYDTPDMEVREDTGTLCLRRKRMSAS
jgi:lipopolysaccharide biosynthesis regulator YciM